MLINFMFDFSVTHESIELLVGSYLYKEVGNGSVMR